MSSKLLKPGSELHGKPKAAKDLGLKADGGRDIIAPVSKGREGGAAPIRPGRGYGKPSTDKTGPGFTSDYTAMDA